MQLDIRKSYRTIYLIACFFNVLLAVGILLSDKQFIEIWFVEMPAAHAMYAELLIGLIFLLLAWRAR